MRVWGAWVTDGQSAYDRYDQSQAKFGARLRALVPPSEYVDEHERLAALVDENELSRSQVATSLSARALQATTTQQAVKPAKDSLMRDASTDDHRAYAAALERLFAQRRSEYTNAAAASERATDRALGKLKRMRFPAAVATEHQALSGGFREHIAALREFHAASQAAEPDRTVKAAETWEASMAELRRLRARVADRLDYHECWPVPAAPPQTSDQRQP